MEKEKLLSCRKDLAYHSRFRLRMARIDTEDDLLNTDDDEFIKIKGIGLKTLVNILTVKRHIAVERAIEETKKEKEGE